MKFVKSIFTAAGMGVPGILMLFHLPDESRPQSIVSGIYLAMIGLLLAIPAVVIIVSNGMQTSRPDYIFGALFGFAISSCIYLYLLRKIYSGRSWARIAILVAGVLSLLFGGPDSKSSHPASIAIFWTQNALLAAATILWFSKSANSWFKSK